MKHIPFCMVCCPDMLNTTGMMTTLGLPAKIILLAKIQVLNFILASIGGSDYALPILQ